MNEWMNVRKELTNAMKARNNEMADADANWRARKTIRS